MAEQTLIADADAYFDRAAPDGNYGEIDNPANIGAWEWHVESPWTTWVSVRSVVHFDLSAVSAGVALHAKLRLYQSSAGRSPSLNPRVIFYRLLVPFVEDEVTWNSRSTGNAWDEPGVAGGTGDYSATPVATVYIANLVGHDGEWVEISLPAALTKADLEYGIFFAIPEEDVPYEAEYGGSGNASFHSREAGSSLAPQLVIDVEASAPTATLGATAPITADSTSAKTFTVTFDADTAIDVSDLATGNLTVSGPHGYSETATFVSVDTNTDGTPRVATYTTPAPTGGWTWLANGTYTVSMVASQVSDTSDNYVAAGSIGTFLCRIAGAPTLHYRAINASNGQPVKGDAANHTIRIAYDGAIESPWSDPSEVGSGSLPGIYAVDLTEAQAAEPRLCLGGVSDTENVLIEPLLDVPGPLYVSPTDVLVARDANAILRGAVFVDETYTADTYTFYTTLPTRADGYADMVLRFDDGSASGVWRQIASSETVDTYTKITLSTELDAAPATGTLVSVGGNKE